MNETTNWAGNVTLSAAGCTVRLAGRAAAAGRRQRRMRVLGTGHSFNRIADTDGDLVSLAGLPPEIASTRTGRVTVGGGVRYGELAGHLHAHGLRAAQPRLAAAHLGRRCRARPAHTAPATRNGNLAAAVRGSSWSPPTVTSSVTP